MGPRFLTSFLAILSIFFVFNNVSVYADQSKRYTAIIVLQPHKISGKKWDLGKGADPALCTKYGCYVSRGLHKEAKFFKGKKAFFPAVNARSCSNKLSCVFRGLILPQDKTDLWPVDLDGFNHDQMEAQKATIDHTCRLTRGHLKCYNGIYTQQYSLWLVPEYIAEKAGRKTLDYAIFKGINDEREKYISNFLEDEKHNISDIVGKFYDLVLNTAIPHKCTINSDVIAEAFFVSDIFSSKNRKPAIFLKNWLLSNDLSHVKRVSQVKPRVFWKIHNAIKQLSVYAHASKRQEFSHQKGLNYIDHGKVNSLVIGWDTKSRAKRIIDKCIYGKKLDKRHL